MSQPVALADLIPRALDAFRTPHLRRIDTPSAPTDRPADAPVRHGLSQVLARVDAAYRRAA